MRKIALPLIVALLCLGMSCNQSESVTEKVPEVKQLANLVLNSTKLKGGNVTRADLDLDHAMFATSPSGRPALVIPYLANGSDNFVVALLDDSKKNVLFAAIVNASFGKALGGAAYKNEPASDPNDPLDPHNNPSGATNLTNPDPAGTAAAAYNAGTFNGYVGFTIPNQYVLNYHFNLSHAIGVTTAIIGNDRCKGWTETGGPLDCAGHTMSTQGPLATIDCYMKYMICLAISIADCLWNGCALT
jgi:hypothetical protein